MGRPINYKKIGGDTSQDGNQLVFQAWFTDEAEAEDAFLVKQMSTNTFKLAAVADSDRVGIFKLGETATEGDVAVLNAPVIDDFEVSSLVSNSPTFSNSDGSYSVTLAGGDFTTAATADVVISLDEISSITVTNAGSYKVDPSGISLTATVAGQEVIFTALTTANTTIETVKKITQHRVYTFEGNAHKYYVDPDAKINETNLPVA